MRILICKSAMIFPPIVVHYVREVTLGIIHEYDVYFGTNLSRWAPA